MPSASANLLYGNKVLGHFALKDFYSSFSYSARQQGVMIAWMINVLHDMMTMIISDDNHLMVKQVG